MYDIERLQQIFIKIKSVFVECYVKEEYFVCKNISNKLGQVFQSIIEEQNKMLLNGTMNAKDADILYEKIISYSVGQIDMAKNCKCEYFIEDLINNNYHNIISCIKTQQYNLYKKYIQKINMIIFDFQKNEYDLLVNLIFKMYSKVSKKLITLSNDKEWIEYLFSDLYEMTMSLNYIKNNTNIKYFLELLVYSLLDSLENRDELHKYLFELLKKFSKESAKMNRKTNECVVYYAYYSNELISKSNLDAIKEFNELIFEIEDDLINDPKWVDFIFYYLSIINNKWEEEFSDLVRKKNVEILLDLISLDISNNYNIMLPNFNSIINKNIYNLNIIEDVCDDFYKLFNRAILKNNNSIFYLFSEELSDCIIALEKDSKDVQKLLFYVYIKILIRVSKINNKIFKEITFIQLMRCIEEMDKKKSISSDFGDYIIENLLDIARDNFHYGATIVREIVSLLYNLMHGEDALNFIIKNETKKILVCRSIFNIGIDSIENNQEESLRQVSNALGWLIIDSIDRGDDTIVKYLLNRCIDLYKLSKSLSITDKTITFIMTLFTTVGTYCCKSPKTYRYRNIIIQALLNEDESIIYTAIKLRTSENENWNELFDNKTEELTKEFVKNCKLEKQKNDKKEKNKQSQKNKQGKNKDLIIRNEVAFDKLT